MNFSKPKYLRILILVLIINISACKNDPSKNTPYSNSINTCDKCLGEGNDWYKKNKNKGEIQWGNSEWGKFKSSILFQQQWFATFPKAQYILDPYNENKIVQISLSENIENFDDTRKRLEKYLNVPNVFQKSPPNAPTIQYAQWIQGDIQYNLQDFGNHTDLFILSYKKK